MSDHLNQLAVAAASSGADEDFTTLITACRPMIASHIRRIGFRNAIIGADDLAQIAHLAVREALASWTPERSGFGSFAGRVIRCRLLSSVFRQGSRPGAVSLSQGLSSRHRHRPPDEDEAGMTISDTLRDPRPDPALTIERRDTAEAILSTLAPGDRRIIQQITEGRGYEEIGQAIGLSAKGVDNRVQAIRRRARAKLLAA